MLFFFSSRRRHTRWTGDWSSDVCSSDLSSPRGGRVIRALRLVLATLLPLGCASAPVAPPAAVRPPPSAPAPSALPPAPQVSPRVDNPQGAERDVQARLAHVAQVIDQIDPSKLASEQRQTLSSVQDFVTKATEALRAK